ncbi:ferredoxin--NADP reductase [Pseudonocardia lacus]|uniref:ferredoxin--NADP reductase n=1 Tax=Pseudonocardia lacus TaxID=2835865 RepID=UPI0027E22711|nr:ferredoxin--NADP reductase [Pseudonocardia lacus]
MTTTPEQAGTAGVRGGCRLRVREVVVETADARSVVLEVPPEHAERFRYAPGQFLTVRVPGSGGRTAARCYSLAGVPGLDEHLTVTVKRVAGGAVSNWICDNLRPGHELEALPPAGRFTPASLDADLLLFAGGSGITPIMSIARSVLERGSGTVVLCYANRDEQSVIFADRLRELAARYPGRMVLRHLLESAEGLPTVARLRDLAEPHRDREAAFVCGPAPFMAAVVAALAEAGVPADRVVLERYLSLSSDPFAEPAEAQEIDAAADPTARLVVTIDGGRHELDWPRSTLLLDLLREAGLDAPYSCREGACSACSCRLRSGAVAMAHNEVLEQEDLDDGWVLACQSRPVSDEVEVTYDD